MRFKISLSSWIEKGCEKSKKYSVRSSDISHSIASNNKGGGSQDQLFEEARARTSLFLSVNDNERQLHALSRLVQRVGGIALDEPLIQPPLDVELIQVLALLLHSVHQLSFLRAERIELLVGVRRRETLGEKVSVPASREGNTKPLSNQAHLPPNLFFLFVDNLHGHQNVQCIVHSSANVFLEREDVKGEKEAKIMRAQRSYGVNLLAQLARLVEVCDKLVGDLIVGGGALGFHLLAHLLAKVTQTFIAVVAKGLTVAVIVIGGRHLNGAESRR